MTSVPIPDLPVIYPLIQSCIEEKQLGKRLSPDRAMDKIQAALNGGMTTVLVDELYLPKILLILQTGQSIVFDELTCTVLLIYIPREHRTPPRVGQAIEAIETHAREKGAVIINASSWIDKGAGGIGTLWEKNGFTQQEIVYAKQLT